MIDYQKIATAINYYQNLGYQLVEVPWLVDITCLNMTCPVEKMRFIAPLTPPNIEWPVGSAEQGFIKLRLPRGRYCAASPCFRIEDSYEPGIRQRWFYKVELFTAFPGDIQGEIGAMIYDATMLFNSFGAKGCRTVVKDRETDIEYKGMEIGSYGNRGFVEYDTNGKSSEYNWVYGTGLAEPRFSTLLAQN